MAHGEEQNLFTLSDPATAEVTFDLALRGYDRRQVDRYIAQLESELSQFAARRDDALAQNHALAAQVAELQNQMVDVQRRTTAEKPSYKHLGTRVEQIFGMVEEEAADIRRRAEADAVQFRARAEKEIEGVKVGVEKALAERRDAIEAEYAQKNAHADKLVKEAEQQANAIRREVDKVRADVDREVTELRERSKTEARKVQDDASQFSVRVRGEAEKHAADVLAKADAQSADVRRKADEAARAATEAARRQAEQTMSAARGEAESIRAKAKADAERAVEEGRRIVAELDTRRKQIKQEITRLREAVARLTGGGGGLFGEEAEDDVLPTIPSPAAGAKPSEAATQRVAPAQLGAALAASEAGKHPSGPNNGVNPNTGASPNNGVGPHQGTPAQASQLPAAKPKQDAPAPPSAKVIETAPSRPTRRAPAGSVLSYSGFGFVF
jgi:DivIVA domain-containing protein